MPTTTIIDDRTAESSRTALGKVWRALGILTIAISLLLGFAAVSLFGFELVQDRFDHVPEVDCQGYLMMAQSFSRFQWPRWKDDFGRFHGHVWVSVGDGQVMAKYPPGWPLLAAVGYRVGGLPGALWVNRILAILGAIAFFLLACELFNSTAAFICTVIWLFSPMLITESNYPYTHGSDVAFVLLAFLLVIYCVRYGWTWCAICGGFCCGFLPLIRPTSILIWPAIALAAILIWRRGRQRRITAGDHPPESRGFLRGGRKLWADPRQFRWRLPWKQPYRNMLLFAASFAVPVAFLAIYNHVSFGSVFRTGYALTGEQTAFDFSNLAQHFNQIFSSRAKMLADSYWLLIALGLLFRPRGKTGLLCALLLWFIPVFVLYLGYYWFSNGLGFLRFYMCILPAAVLCIGFVLTPEIFKNSIARLALVAGFCAWIHYHQPMVLKHRVIGDDLVSWLTPASDKSTPHQGGANYVNEPFVPLENFLRGRHASVYGYEDVDWTASCIPGVIGYDLEAWTHPNRFFTRVRYDPVRRQRLTALFHSLGQAGLRANFLAHIAADYAAGREIYISGSVYYGPAYWLTRAGWHIASAGVECPGGLYRVSK